MKKKRRSKQLTNLIHEAEGLIALDLWKEAERLLYKAIKLDQLDPEPYYHLGGALCKMKRFDESIQALLIANRLLKNNPRILHLLGWSTFMNGDYLNGKKLLEDALILLPDDVKILCDLAVVVSRLAEDEKAAMYARRALQLAPDDPMTEEVLGAVLYFASLRSISEKKIN